MKEPNRLIYASSPYLLQHAYNPVQWQEWGAEALAQAKKENKLILVSIGYSACHWCHVMEHESFENYEVAEVMNSHFVCIKVDREERPDIDQVYMLAVQLMNGNGGWPLNMICLPDQRPIYGGTYFRKDDWINILLNVANLWQSNPAKAIDYASRLTEGIQQSEQLLPASKNIDFTETHLSDIVDPWKRHFDLSLGGYNRAPKFPLPNNWIFMLRYSYLAADDGAAVATMQTLEKMAMGGIYDQIGGGFARYAVDDRWHVPHFEKMLYDNAQLISLYTEAYQYLKIPLYKQVVEETVEWLNREMSASDGLFFAALDADTEGKEGKFYCWDAEEFNSILGANASVLADYYDIREEGNWEEEHTNVLQRKYNDKEFAAMHQLTTEKLHDLVADAKVKLRTQREKRTRPGLDDKCLTAWNAMTITALVEAALVFENKQYAERARKAIQYLLANLFDSEGRLMRNYKNGKASISAFLDDYAFLIEALIKLYELDFEENWLVKARELTEDVFMEFDSPDNALFYYTATQNEPLIARKQEVMDNVMASSNSVMAQNLEKLGLFYDIASYTDRAKKMLSAVLPVMKSYGSAYSNWSVQLLNEVYGINEIALVGNDADVEKQYLYQQYIPNKVTLGGNQSSLPLLKDKQSVETKIYICRDKTCQLPVRTMAEALKYIK